MSLKVIFMGTPDFAVQSMAAIHASDHELTAVVTVPDKAAGRGKKQKESPVKKYAKEHRLPLLQPERLKEETFLQDLAKFQADVFVVVAFRMLPKVVWEIPRLGTFNAHASLLPNYRGAAPINWALMHGEKRTGVTTFMIDEKIDTGAILLQDQLTISPTENFASLHDKLADMSASLCLKTLDALEEGITTQAQKLSGMEKDAPKLGPHNTVIDWTKGLDQIVWHIRGLNPFPSAWTTLNQNGETLRIKIFEATSVKGKQNHSLGKVITDKKSIRIAHPEGFIEILELQLPNKRRMKATELLNGFRFLEDAVLK